MMLVSVRELEVVVVVGAAVMESTVCPQQSNAAVLC